MPPNLEGDFAIHFPDIPEAGSLALHSFGLRINGLWLVTAELPPRLSWAERPVIGRLALDVSLGPGHERLEPATVNYLTHIWILNQAETAGLQVTNYQDLNASQRENSTAFAQYIIARA